MRIIQVVVLIQKLFLRINEISSFILKQQGVRPMSKHLIINNMLKKVEKNKIKQEDFL